MINYVIYLIIDDIYHYWIIFFEFLLCSTHWPHWTSYLVSKEYLVQVHEKHWCDRSPELECSIVCVLPGCRRSTWRRRWRCWPSARTAGCRRSSASASCRRPRSRPPSAAQRCGRLRTSCDRDSPLPRCLVTSGTWRHVAPYFI